MFFLLSSWWQKEPDPDPYLWLMDPDADPGGPKSYGSSGSVTLIQTYRFQNISSQNYRLIAACPTRWFCWSGCGGSTCPTTTWRACQLGWTHCASSPSSTSASISSHSCPSHSATFTHWKVFGRYRYRISPTPNLWWYPQSKNLG